MNRRLFIQNTGAIGAGLLINSSFITSSDFPKVRISKGERNFTSKAIEEAIAEFRKGVKDKELAWLFENCFPNTLDTTVSHSMKIGIPDTYVITGDIDAMWLRDSSAQVWPYLNFIRHDKSLRQLVAGVIRRQTSYVNKDPYANAFYDDPNKVGEWSKDLTNMLPGVHERKWEIDSLCYPVRLAYAYWKITGDMNPFSIEWKNSIKSTLSVFKDQQRKEGHGKYKFQRTTAVGTDTLPMSGYGYPVNPVGLICSAFRPSDDATIFSFLIPSNFFAVVSLRQAAEMVLKISKDQDLALQLTDLADEVEDALKNHAIVEDQKYGKVYAYEVNGFGSYLLMDDANVPSLLSLPYLGAVSEDDEIYRNTRRLILSKNNPFFFSGKAGEGIGGPHVGSDMIWPMAITMRGLTSNDDAEIKACIRMLVSTHAGTGFMHETFNKDNPEKFTRSWFAWANTLFGEFLWKIFKSKPELLS